MVATTLDIIGFDGAFTFCAVAVLSALILRFGTARGTSGFAFIPVVGNRVFARGSASGQLVHVPLAADQDSGDVDLLSQHSAQMPIDEQWERVSGFLRSTLDAGVTAQQKHSAASRQLDAVDYALTCLLDELRPLMPQATRADDVVEVVARAEDTVKTEVTDGWRDASIAA